MIVVIVLLIFVLSSCSSALYKRVDKPFKCQIHLERKQGDVHFEISDKDMGPALDGLFESSIPMTLPRGFNTMTKFIFTLQFPPKTYFSYAHVVFRLPILVQNSHSYEIIKSEIVDEDIKYDEQMQRTGVSSGAILAPLFKVKENVAIKNISVTLGFTGKELSTFTILRPVELVDVFFYNIVNDMVQVDYFYTFEDKDRTLQVSTTSHKHYFDLIPTRVWDEVFYDGNITTGINSLVQSLHTEVGGRDTVIFKSGIGVKVYALCFALFNTEGGVYSMYTDIDVHGLYEKRNDLLQLNLGGLNSASFLGKLNRDIRCFRNRASDYTSLSRFSALLYSKTNSMFVTEVKFYTQDQWRELYPYPLFDKSIEEEIHAYKLKDFCRVKRSHEEEANSVNSATAITTTSALTKSDYLGVTNIPDQNPGFYLNEVWMVFASLFLILFVFLFIFSSCFLFLGGF